MLLLIHINFALKQNVNIYWYLSFSKQNFFIFKLPQNAWAVDAISSFLGAVINEELCADHFAELFLVKVKPNRVFWEVSVEHIGLYSENLGVFLGGLDGLDAVTEDGVGVQETIGLLRGSEGVTVGHPA